MNDKEIYQHYIACHNYLPILKARCESIKKQIQDLMEQQKEIEGQIHCGERVNEIYSIKTEGGIMKIDQNENEILVFADYHPDFVASARKFNGKFFNDKAWHFDIRLADRIRKLCVDIYGTDGSYKPDTCTCRINLSDNKLLDSIDNAELYLFGRQLLRRRGRDYNVEQGNGVIVLSGGFPSSGGSTKHPLLKPYKDTILEVFDCPITLAKRDKEKFPEAITILDKIPENETIDLTNVSSKDLWAELIKRGEVQCQ